VEGGEAWFPVNPRDHHVVRNRFINGVRCVIAHVYRAVDGFALWKIDGQPVKPNQLIKLERGRSSNKAVRVANILVHTSEMKARGHVIARELLCVHDEPKLELRKCLAPSDGAVKLVAVGVRERPPSEPRESEPEVVIQPVPEEDCCFRSFSEIPQVPVKVEPFDSVGSQDPGSIFEIEPIPLPTVTESLTPSGLRRSKRLQTKVQPLTRARDGRLRKTPR